MLYVKHYPAPALDRQEIWRYAGARGEIADLAPLLDECLREAEGKLTYTVAYREFPVTPTENGLSLGFAETGSLSLQRALGGCSHLILFAATVGIGLDRLITRYETLSPAKALLFSAIGAERIESLCDAFVQDIEAAGRRTRPRVSPGYGDIPLAMQHEIFAALDCPRKIGLTLNQSLLMSPTKSVTAIIGLYDDCPVKDV